MGCDRRPGGRTGVWCCLSRGALPPEPGDADSRLRDVAERVGITERAVQAIVADLEECGAITRIREGRRNHYELHDNVPLRHPVEAHCTIRDLLAIFNKRREKWRERCRADAKFAEKDDVEVVEARPAG